MQIFSPLLALGRYIFPVAIVFFLNAPVFAHPLNHLQFLGDNSNGTNYISSLYGTATSKDGNFVYTISFVENSVTVFSRDPSTKLLNLVDVTLEDVVNKTGVHHPYAILVSPDDKYVYVAGLEPGFGNGTTDRAIVVLQRNEVSGNLTTVQVYKNPKLNDPSQIALSADGNNIYVTCVNVPGVLVLKKAANGVLSEQQYQSNFISGFAGMNPRPTGAAAVISSDQNHLYLAVEQRSSPPYGAMISHFARDQNTGNITYLDQIDYTQANMTGFVDLRSLGISPDGKFLYATTSGNTNGSIVVFSISANGALSFSERYTLDDPNGNPIKLYWPNDIVFSNNGKLAYVSDNVTDALLVFGRNLTTGSLTYFGAEVDNKDGVIDTRDANRVELSPDNSSAFISAQWGLTVFDIHTALSLTNTTTSTTVAPNGTATFKLEVTNTSEVTAHNTTLTFMPPAGAAITAISPTNNSTICSQANGSVTCQIGSLAAKAAEIVSISIGAPTALGTATTQASVAADEIDSNMLDNSASASITVASSSTNASSETNTKKKGGGGSFDWYFLGTFGLLAFAHLSRSNRKSLN